MPSGIFSRTVFWNNVYVSMHLVTIMSLLCSYAVNDLLRSVIAVTGSARRNCRVSTFTNQRVSTTVRVSTWTMSITRLAAVACARISRQRLSTSSIRNDAQSSLTTKSTPTAGKVQSSLVSTSYVVAWFCITYQILDSSHPRLSYYCSLS